jgi:cobalt-zinc-cadmium efflux system membrane fusion protein
MLSSGTKAKAITAICALALSLAVGAYLSEYMGSRLPLVPVPDIAQAAGTAGADTSKRAGGERSDADRLDLTEKQKETVKVEAVTEREFPVEKQSVGAIDFNEDMTLQVFAPYQGRIIRLFADVGDDVEEGPDAVHDRQPRFAAG